MIAVRNQRLATLILVEGGIDLKAQDHAPGTAHRALQAASDVAAFYCTYGRCVVNNDADVSVSRISLPTTTRLPSLFKVVLNSLKIKSFIFCRHFSRASNTSNACSFANGTRQIKSRALFRLLTAHSNTPADTDADTDGTIDALDASAKSLAMHVVAARPAFLDEASAPPAELEKEKSLLLEQAKDSGKDPKVLGRMVEGRWVLLLLWGGWLCDSASLVQDKREPYSAYRQGFVRFSSR